MIRRVAVNALFFRTWIFDNLKMLSSTEKKKEKHFFGCPEMTGRP